MILEVRRRFVRIPFEAVRHPAILSSSRSFREVVGITIGAQPRAARDGALDFLLLLPAWLVGCSALAGSSRSLLPSVRQRSLSTSVVRRTFTWAQPSAPQITFLTDSNTALGIHGFTTTVQSASGAKETSFGPVALVLSS